MRKILFALLFLLMLSSSGCDSDSKTVGKAVSDPFIEIIGVGDIMTIDIDDPVDSDNFIVDESLPIPETADDETQASDVETASADVTSSPVTTSAESEVTAAETVFVTEVSADKMETVIEEKPDETTDAPAEVHGVFAVINTSSGKYHLDADCSGVKTMNSKNRLDRTFDSVGIMLAAGYSPCGICSKDNESAAVTTVSKTPDPDYSGNAVLNTNSKKIHTDVNCRHVSQIKAENRKDVVLDEASMNELLSSGYSCCKACS